MSAKVSPSIEQTALWVACAAAIQMAESLIPPLLPGIRLGLANMITLVILERHGFRSALEVSLLRTVVSALCLGTFLAPAFLLSFAAAGVSVALMGLLHRAVAARERPALSLVGISVAGAAAHVSAQIGVAYLLLVRHPGVFLLLPWLGLSAVVTGWVTGYVALMVCRRLQHAPAVRPAAGEAGLSTAAGQQARSACCTAGTRSPYSGGDEPAALCTSSDRHTATGWMENANPLRLGGWVPTPSLPRRRPFAGKAGLALLVTAAALVSASCWVLAALLCLLAVLAGVARLSPASLLAGLKRGAPFLAVSFLAPVVFTHGGLILLRVGPVTVTQEGARAGGLLALRLIVLMAGATLVARLATGPDLAAGLRAVLAPLKRAGVSADRPAAILALALRAAPALAEHCRRTLRLQVTGHGWRTLLPAVADGVAALYRETEEQTS